MNPFSAYESMQPYKDGVIVSYTQPLAIDAQENGLVIFTGFTRESGKTVTVLYDNGDEVTYGFVGKFSKLPYTAVKKGDTLALMDEGAIYLMVKRDGVKLDASLLPTYLSGGGTMKFRLHPVLLPFFLFLIIRVAFRSMQLFLFRCLFMKRVI